MATSTQLYATGTEYVHVPVTADVTLDAQPVDLAFLTGNTVPDAATTWYPAEWEDAPGLTRTARVLVGADGDAVLTAGSYTVYMRLTDTPEVPIRSAGTITVK